MPKTALYNMEGAAIGEVELSEEIFAVICLRFRG